MLEAAMAAANPPLWRNDGGREDAEAAGIVLPSSGEENADSIAAIAAASAPGGCMLGIIPGAPGQNGEFEFPQNAAGGGICIQGANGLKALAAAAAIPAACRSDCDGPVREGIEPIAKLEPKPHPDSGWPLVLVSPR